MCLLLLACLECGFSGLIDASPLIAVINPPESAYVYEENIKTRVVIQRGGKKYWGTIDAAGNLVLDPRDPGSDLDGVIISGPPRWHYTNFPISGTQEAVFEYRSSRLIKGILNKDGNFIPDLNGQIIDFKDYKYSKKALRIYNLPGRFVPKNRKIIANPEYGKLWLPHIREGMDKKEVDKMLKENRVHESRQGRATSFYYLRYGIVVEYDAQDKVGKAYVLERPSK